MKKIFAVVIALLFFVTGCVGKESIQQQTPSPTVTNTEKEEPAAEVTADEPMKITFFKFGNADSILFEIGDSTMLIDTGEEGDGSKISAVLKNRQINKIDYMIITHFDKDHVGGAARIIQKVEVNNILMPDYRKDSEEYKAYVAAAAEKEISPVNLIGVFKFSLNDAVIKIIPPSEVDSSDDNNSSLMIELEYGSKRFLFAGDAEKKRLAEYLKEPPGRFDFLKVPHHGRQNDMSRAFLETVAPEYAVICCGNDEQDTYAVSKLLENMGAQTYYTRDGMVTLLCDGSNIHISQKR